MSKLYQDAILDAKALRASAMANAKAALEEAFEPKIQEMLRLKLTEELEEDEALEEDMGVEGEELKQNMEAQMPEDMEENLNFSEAELEEILAELEELSKPEMEETLNEAEEDEEGEEAEEDEAEEEEVEGEEEVGDETKIIDITLGDLKQVLQSVMAGQQDMGMDMASDEADADSEAEAEISLDEILAELEAEGMDYTPEAEGLEEKKKAKHDDDDDEEKKKVEEELEEANSTIEELRHSLQEVNLLNAKYLYMNKLFKSKSLTESQKVKVINALDRASSVTEVKNTYETLKESFNATKAPLKESIGFASQAAGVAPKANIVDSDPFVNRWKTLAGIK
jgi:hypothetical protein